MVWGLIWRLLLLPQYDKFWFESLFGNIGRKPHHFLLFFSSPVNGGSIHFNIRFLRHHYFKELWCYKKIKLLTLLLAIWSTNNILHSNEIIFLSLPLKVQQRHATVISYIHRWSTTMARSSTKQNQLNLSKKYLKVANCDEWITYFENIKGSYFFVKGSLLKELKTY